MTLGVDSCQQSELSYDVNTLVVEMYPGDEKPVSLLGLTFRSRCENECRDLEASLAAALYSMDAN